MLTANYFIMDRIICYLILVIGVSIASCNLSKPIDIKLPPYEKQLIVECYLENGKPYRLALSESSEFTGPVIPNVLQFASVTITHKGIRDSLIFLPTIDTLYRKFYNYQSATLAQYDTVNEYFLEVKDLLTQRVVTGKTKFMPVVNLDNVKILFNKDSLAAVKVNFDDNILQSNFYRFLIHSDSSQNEQRFGFFFNDALYSSSRIELFTNYRFDYGDPLYFTLYHLEKQYYDFLRSTNDAANANGNPFAQPSAIKSTVNGGIGVFTTLSYNRKYKRAN